MNIKNKLTGLLCALLAQPLVACGAAYEDEPFEGDLEQLELDTAEQELSANQGGFGWSESSGSRSACNTTSTTQACRVPFGNFTTPIKRVTYCIVGRDSGSTAANFTSGEKLAIAGALTALDNQVSWAFSNVTDTGAGCTLRIKPGILSGSSTSNDVSFFADFQTNGNVTLTESVPGTWKSFQQGVCTIDMAKVYTKYPFGPDSLNALNHLAGRCGHLSVGIGSHSAGSTRRITDNSMISSGQVPSGMSSKDVCLANSWDGNGPGAWAFNSATCN